jgi:hypothetical protein
MHGDVARLSSCEIFTKGTSMNPVQPQVLNGYGAVLTVGIVNNQDRTAIVLPVFTSSTTLNRNDFCADAVNSFTATVLGGLLTLMSSDANVSFVSAEGMQDGYPPFRTDYGLTDQVGTQPANTLPSSCGTLIAFYQETADIIGTARIRVAKTTVPGLSQANFDGENITTGQSTSALTWGNALQNGWPSVLSSSDNWYRGLAMPLPRATATEVGRINLVVVRGYVGTQRRRNTPH